MHPPYPFPGMNPYLEHPLLWPGFQLRLTVVIANQLQPLLDPRYIASVESRKFQERSGDEESDEVRQRRILILDTANDMRPACVLELVSPTNKQAGPARSSYLKSRKQILSRECDLVEVDLLRHGAHVLAISEERVKDLPRHDYLVCVNRRATEHMEAYSCSLRDGLPRIAVPLKPYDVPLDLQAAVEKAYEDGRYGWRLKYDRPCDPPLSDDDQQWANELLAK